MLGPGSLRRNCVSPVPWTNRVDVGVIAERQRISRSQFAAANASAMSAGAARTPSPGDIAFLDVDQGVGRDIQLDELITWLISELLPEQEAETVHANWLGR